MKSNWNRRVIPRWRASTVSASLPECLPTKQVHLDMDAKNWAVQEINMRLTEWAENQDVGIAADILNFSHVDGVKHLLVKPAEQIHSLGKDAPTFLHKIAAEILGQETNTPKILNLSKHESLYSQIARIKIRLLQNPRDAISLIDLARLYAALGLKEKANKAIITAAALWPDHRFVLRSATRFLIHNDDTERAIYLLQKSERTNIDPWLLATRIAAENVLGEVTSSIKKGKAMFDSNRFAPIHLSELGSAIATIQVVNGNTKEAKRTFNKSLTAANDNAIAQAVWASNHFGLAINVQRNWFEDRYSAESNVYKKTAEGDFEGAIDASIDWFDDEPFSTRPMKAASFAASILSDFSASEKFARDGLILDRDDPELSHNLVCALAAQDKTEEAIEELRKTIRFEQQSSNGLSGHAVANAGMIMFRQGALLEGERLYRDAIKIFEGAHNLESKALALAFLSRESINSNAPNAQTIIAEAKDFISTTKSLAAAKVLEPTLSDTDLIDIRPQKKLFQKIKWHHDSEKNILIIEKTDPFKV